MHDHATAINRNYQLKLFPDSRDELLITPAVISIFFFLCFQLVNGWNGYSVVVDLLNDIPIASPNLLSFLTLKVVAFLLTLPIACMQLVVHILGKTGATVWQSWWSKQPHRLSVLLSLLFVWTQSFTRNLRWRKSTFSTLNLPPTHTNTFFFLSFHLASASIVGQGQYSVYGPTIDYSKGRWR